MPITPNYRTESVGFARQGLATANDGSIFRTTGKQNDQNQFKPIATGGSDASILPKNKLIRNWTGDGSEINDIVRSLGPKIRILF